MIAGPRSRSGAVGADRRSQSGRRRAARDETATTPGVIGVDAGPRDPYEIAAHDAPELARDAWIAWVGEPPEVPREAVPPSAGRRIKAGVLAGDAHID